MAPNRWGLFVASSLSFIGLERILLTAAMNNHSPNLSRVGGGPAVSDVAWVALATGSGDFALGGGKSFAIFESRLSFAIFESSRFGF